MAKANQPLDTELLHLEPEARWREWLARIEAVLFASAEPVSMDILARVVGRSCNLELLIAELQSNLERRPYQLMRVAGGFGLRTRPAYADVIHAAFPASALPALTRLEQTVLMTIAYYQPITRDQVGWILGHRIEGRRIDRDLFSRLRRLDLIANGPRSPEPGAPILYITTPEFLDHFGLASLEDLPEREKLEQAGLLDKARLLSQRKALASDPVEKAIVE